MSKEFYKKVDEKTYHLSTAQWEKIDNNNYELEAGFGKIYLDYCTDWIRLVLL